MVPSPGSSTRTDRFPGSPGPVDGPDDSNEHPHEHQGQAGGNGACQPGGVLRGRLAQDGEPGQLEALEEDACFMLSSTVPWFRTMARDQLMITESRTMDRREHARHPDEHRRPGQERNGEDRREVADAGDPLQPGVLHHAEEQHHHQRWSPGRTTPRAPGGSCAPAGHPGCGDGQQRRRAWSRTGRTAGSSSSAGTDRAENPPTP